MRFDCDVCKSSYKNVSAFNQHLKVNKKCLKLRGEFVGVTCGECNKVFRSDISLRNHVKLAECSMKTRIISEKEYQEYQSWLKSKNIKLIQIHLPYLYKSIVMDVMIHDMSRYVAYAEFFCRIFKDKVTLENGMISYHTDQVYTVRCKEFVQMVVRNTFNKISLKFHIQSKTSPSSDIFFAVLEDLINSSIPSRYNTTISENLISAILNGLAQK